MSLKILALGIGSSGVSVMMRSVLCLGTSRWSRSGNSIETSAWIIRIGGITSNEVSWEDESVGIDCCEDY